MFSGKRDGFFGFFASTDGLIHWHSIQILEFKKLISGQRDGKVIKWLPGNDYYPTLEDADPPPEPTVEELAAILRSDRNNALTESDKYMFPDYPITDEQRQQVLAYRQALRDITLDDNFPNVELPVDPVGK